MCTCELKKKNARLAFVPNCIKFVIELDCVGGAVELSKGALHSAPQLVSSKKGEATVSMSSSAAAGSSAPEAAKAGELLFAGEAPAFSLY